MLKKNKIICAGRPSCPSGRCSAPALSAPVEEKTTFVKLTETLQISPHNFKMFFYCSWISVKYDKPPSNERCKDAKGNEGKNLRLPKAKHTYETF